MQNKTLFTILIALCALLIFETGYLVGIGEQRKIYRTLASRCIYPHQQTFYPNWKFPRMPKEEGSIQANKKGFFVATMALRDTDQGKIITVNLPGVDRRDVNVEVNGKYLTIQARHERGESINRDNFYAEGLSSSKFVQSITLDDNANLQQIRAEFNKGALTITIPKDKRSRKPSGKAFTVPIK